MNWQRLEGGHIDATMTEGMASAIADPLWLLARQWQVGEFRGEDAATPILIDANVVSGSISEYWTQGSAGRAVVKRAAAPWPLETLVEHEAVLDGPAAGRVALDAGAALVRSLRLAGATPTALAELVAAFPSVLPIDHELDPLGAAQLELLAARLPDGTALARKLDAAGGDPSLLPGFDGFDAAQLDMVRSWWAGQATLFCDAAPGGPNAWRSDRMEYAFGLTGVTPDGSVELVAPEYPGGTLDWYHTDVGAKSTAEGPSTTRKQLTSLANPLQFAGMPAARWWEFEDHDVDFGDMAGGPEDLARSVLAAYAMVAGDDWFVVPCELTAGSLSRVTRLRVLDDFGITTTVRATAANDAAAGARAWRFFELSDDPGPDAGEAPLLFLPPVVHAGEHSRPLERVEFRRDEMANMAWGVELLVEGQAGRPVDRRAPRSPSAVAPEPALPTDTWRYRLATEVPDHWVPMVPVRIEGDQPQIALRRGRLADDDEQRAKGRILEPEHSLVLHEEEIPSGGVSVERRWQMARGADGAVRVWVGRKKSPGGGPMARTPLRFDQLSGFPTRPSGS